MIKRLEKFSEIGKGKSLWQVSSDLTWVQINSETAFLILCTCMYLPIIKQYNLIKIFYTIILIKLKMKMLRHENKYASIYSIYAGLLVCLDKWISNQESHIPSIILFIISYRLRALKTFYIFVKRRKKDKK